MKDYLIVFRENDESVYDAIKQHRVWWLNGLTALYILPIEDNMVAISIEPLTKECVLKQIEVDNAATVGSIPIM